MTQFAAFIPEALEFLGARAVPWVTQRAAPAVGRAFIGYGKNLVQKPLRTAGMTALNAWALSGAVSEAGGLSDRVFGTDFGHGKRGARVGALTAGIGSEDPGIEYARERTIAKALGNVNPFEGLQQGYVGDDLFLQDVIARNQAQIQRSSERMVERGPSILDIAEMMGVLGG